MTRKTFLALTSAIALSLGVLIAPPVSGASPGGPAVNWHIGYYAPSNITLRMAEAPSASGSLAVVPFTSVDNTALLLNTQGASGYLGDDLNKTVTADFTIAGAEDFSAYPDQCTPAGIAPSAMIYFESSASGSDSYVDYWWAKSSITTLGNGSFTLTAFMKPSIANWGDWDGNGDYTDAAFSQAASHVIGIGLSFGGYCHYEGGVGTSNGLGSLSLTGFTVS